MDEKTQREMMAYYDERAPEYDDIYNGKGPASLDGSVYKPDVLEISKMVADFGKGDLIHIACGTGFWLRYYSGNCVHVTLLDQSEKMFEECRKKVEDLEILNRVTFIQADFLKTKFNEAKYDSALAGFVISHLTKSQEMTFFEKLQRILKAGAQFMVIDSAWNEERKKVRKKEGAHERTLNDGRKFMIYKRYFDEADIRKMLERHGFSLQALYEGTAFIAGVAQKLS